MDTRMDGRGEQRQPLGSVDALDALDILGGAAATPSRRERVRAAWRRPLVRALAGVAAMGLLALLYLSQVAGVTLANDRLSTLNAERSRLQRQDSQLHAQLGTYTSPAYIDRRARAMGLAPAPFGSAVYIAVSHGPVPMIGQDAPSGAAGGGQP